MKRFVCLVTAVVLVLTLFVCLTGCGKSEPFECYNCGKTITDGHKNTITDTFGDEWDYCDDCYKELKAFAAG